MASAHGGEVLTDEAATISRAADIILNSCRFQHIHESHPVIQRVKNLREDWYARSKGRGIQVLERAAFVPKPARATPRLPVIGN